MLAGGTTKSMGSFASALSASVARCDGQAQAKCTFHVGHLPMNMKREILEAYFSMEGKNTFTREPIKGIIKIRMERQFD